MRGLLLPAFLLLLSTQAAEAFSVRVHVYGANLVRDDAVDGTVDLGPWGSFPVDRDVREAIDRYPSYFRAGAVGPDGYPDIFTGQAFTHGDQGAGVVQFLIDQKEISCQRAVNEGWCDACSGTTCTAAHDQVVPFKFVNMVGDQVQRPQRYWRSIDWAQALIEDARREVIIAARSGLIEEKNKSLQALAFAFGYLMHYAGDGFAHQWVNLYAEGAWDYLDENLQPEYRHVALERYIEHLMEPAVADSTAWKARKVDVPVWFVRKYLMQKYIGGCTVDPVKRELVCQDDSAAAKAGHIRFLFGYRETLEQLKNKLPAPPASDFAGLTPPVNIDVANPGSYSSIWSYMVNRCIFEVAAGGFLQEGNCMERIFLAAFHTYINNRLIATDRAIDQWVVTSNAIVQDMLNNGVSINMIKQHLIDYQTNFLMPMFLPGANEPLRQWFGISCTDAGPPKFAQVCEAMMAEARLVVAEVQTQVEEAFRQKMASWIEAYDRYLCALEKLVEYYTQPEIMMNWVFCGTPAACPRSLARREQVEQDVLSSKVADDFMPFSNAVTMSKLALFEDQKRDMTELVKRANGMRGTNLDPTMIAFVNEDVYDRILFESIASLDGTHAIEEDVPSRGGVHNPNRIVFDQFRKLPRSGLLLDASLQSGVYEPLFDVTKQDPDADQIILAYDLCPCAPEVLAKNALDHDNDRVGDTCDPDANDQRLASIVTGLPSSDFDSQSTRDQLADGFRKVIEQCVAKSNADAEYAAGKLYLEIEDFLAQGRVSHDAGNLLTEEVKTLMTLFANGGMACGANNLPAVVTSCP
jgi:hypothetical protein